MLTFLMQILVIISLFNINYGDNEINSDKESQQAPKQKHRRRPYPGVTESLKQALEKLKDTGQGNNGQSPEWKRKSVVEKQMNQLCRKSLCKPEINCDQTCSNASNVIMSAIEETAQVYGAFFHRIKINSQFNSTIETLPSLIRNNVFKAITDDIDKEYCDNVYAAEVNFKVLLEDESIDDYSKEIYTKLLMNHANKIQRKMKDNPKLSDKLESILKILRKWNVDFTPSNKKYDNLSRSDEFLFSFCKNYVCPQPEKTSLCENFCRKVMRVKEIALKHLAMLMKNYFDDYTFGNELDRKLLFIEDSDRYPFTEAIGKEIEKRYCELVYDKYAKIQSEAKEFEKPISLVALATARKASKQNYQTIPSSMGSGRKVDLYSNKNTSIAADNSTVLPSTSEISKNTSNDIIKSTKMNDTNETSNGSGQISNGTINVNGKDGSETTSEAKYTTTTKSIETKTIETTERSSEINAAKTSTEASNSSVKELNEKNSTFNITDKINQKLSELSDLTDKLPKSSKQEQLLELLMQFMEELRRPENQSDFEKSSISGEVPESMIEPPDHKPERVTDIKEDQDFSDFNDFYSKPSHKKPSKAIRERDSMYKPENHYKRPVSRPKDRETDTESTYTTATRDYNDLPVTTRPPSDLLDTDKKTTRDEEDTALDPESQKRFENLFFLPPPPYKNRTKSGR